MNAPYCKTLQQRLLDEGVTALSQDVEAEAHLGECDECFAYLEALAQLDETLAVLPDHEPAAELVAATIARVNALPAEAKRVRTRLFSTIAMIPANVRPFAFAATALLALFFVITDRFTSSAPSVRYGSSSASSSAKETGRWGEATFNDDRISYGTGGSQDLAAGRATDKASSLEQPASMPLESEQMDSAGASSNDGAAKQRLEALQKNVDRIADSTEEDAAKDGVAQEKAAQVFGGEGAVQLDRMEDYREKKREDAPAMQGAVAAAEESFDADGASDLEQLPSAAPQNADPQLLEESSANETLSSASAAAPSELEPERRAGVFAKPKSSRRKAADRWSVQDAFEVESQLSELREGTVGKVVAPKKQDAAAGFKPAPEAENRLGYAPPPKSPVIPPGRRQNRAAGVVEQQVAVPEPRPVDELSGELAAEYVKRLARTEGLTFKDPSGYWSNSYLPGDAELRSLHSSLATQDLSEVEQLLRHPSGLHLDASQPAQPFDAPTDAAIAVFLQSDKQSVDGPTRMTLQVGLKGTVRGQGIRPAMNMGVVIDLTGADDQRIQETIWSVAYALNELRDVGDKVSLAVVGCEASQDLSAAQFKHGYLKVLAAQAGECNGRGGSRLDALRRISKSVTASDDPNAPLGSSALLLVAPSGAAPDLALLEGFAHRSAVAGVPLSVIAVGESGSAEFERIALAGQGSRRVLRNAADSKELVKRELSMVGGIVARAVRLRIRLAPGVRLVDVLGSDRLDEARAQRVRDAEKSVDQRISRNLGIQADRGEDEEGIQIVIPVFMAADAHVVLLDVVVPGPGPVADVTVRFKDLAFLKNGIARANLSLANRANADQLGALEQNVLKNRLAFETAQLLKLAAAQTRAGARGEAIALLEGQKQLLDSFAELYTGFARDADMLRDRTLLQDYVELLRLGGSTPWLPSSLRYSAKRKVLPLPRGE